MVITRAQDDIPDLMAGTRPPHVPGKPVPVFTGDELERACAGDDITETILNAYSFTAPPAPAGR